MIWIDLFIILSTLLMFRPLIISKCMMVNMNYLQSKVTIKSTIFWRELSVYPWELLKHINRSFWNKTEIYDKMILWNLKTWYHHLSFRNKTWHHHQSSRDMEWHHESWTYDSDIIISDLETRHDIIRHDISHLETKPMT